MGSGYYFQGRPLRRGHLGIFFGLFGCQGLMQISITLCIRSIVRVHVLGLGFVRESEQGCAWGFAGSDGTRRSCLTFDY